MSYQKFLLFYTFISYNLNPKSTYFYYNNILCPGLNVQLNLSAGV